MILTSDQQLFLRRLDIDSESLALASQTCGVREFIESRVEVFGSSNGYGPHPSGKGIVRYGEKFQELWPKPAKVRK